MLVQHGGDFLGKHFVAGNINHRLEPPVYDNPPGVIPMRQVAAQEPAVVQSLFAQLPGVQVAGEHAGTAQGELAGLAGGGRLQLLVQDDRLEAGQRAPNGFGMLGGIVQIHQRQPHLDDAIALGYRHAVAGVEIPRGLRMEPARNRHDPLKGRGQGASGSLGGQHAHVHRGDIQEGDLVPPGGVQNAFRQVIGADHNRAADFEVEEDGGEEVIGHRKNPEHSVLLGQAQSLVGGMRAFQNFLMGQNHALGCAGGARGEP